MYPVQIATWARSLLSYIVLITLRSMRKRQLWLQTCPLQRYNTLYILFICLAQIYVTALFNNGFNCKVQMCMTDQWMSDWHWRNKTYNRNEVLWEKKSYIHSTTTSGLHKEEEFTGHCVFMCMCICVCVCDLYFAASPCDSKQTKLF
jgi:hypothetical protein